MASYLDGGGLKHLIKQLLDRMYPVGSLYFSTNSVSPAKIYGGQWEKYAEGRVLVGESGTDNDFTLGNTGGSKEINISNQNLPSNVPFLGIGWNSGYVVSGWATDGQVGIKDGGNPNTGINVMPPYISVNIWRRIG